METKLEMTPATVNALHDAIGGLVFAITYQMPVEMREEVSQALSRIAQSKNRVGSTLAAAMLLDYANAAQLAAQA